MPSAEDLTRYLGDRVQGICGSLSAACYGLAPLGEAVSDRLYFARPQAVGEVAPTSSGVVLVAEMSGALDHLTQIVVENPRLEFMRCAGAFFPDAADWPVGAPTIGEGTVVKPGAVLGPGVTIGKDCVIHENVVIKAGSQVGNGVVVQANSTIGSEGFGYERDPRTGEIVRFPHIASVAIEDAVEIGANTCIDRGALADTVVEEGARIDNLVHIAHNVRIGRGAFVIAGATLGGSVRVGAEAWIAPGAVVINGVAIGEQATVGVGSVVTRAVPAAATVAGSPARQMSHFISQLRAIEKLTRDDA